jgi:hypothetical protein
VRHEALAILRGLSSGGYFEHHGAAFDFAPVKIAPVPAEPVPILIGGIARPRPEPALPGPARPCPRGAAKPLRRAR